jgi:Transglycosylase SLT domain
MHHISWIASAFRLRMQARCNCVLKGLTPHQSHRAKLRHSSLHHVRKAVRHCTVANMPRTAIRNGLARDCRNAMGDQVSLFRIWIRVIPGLMLYTSDGLAANLCEHHLKEASVAEGVPLGLLYAVALTETGSGGRLSPYAMNVEGKSALVRSRQEALAVYETAEKQGRRLIDVGCMQINVHYHRRSFNSLEDMFDPRLNIAFAAKFLKSLEQRHGSWTAAVAHYHAGPKNKPAQKRYVCKVLTHLVNAGFGQRTSEAEAYCN